MNTTSIKLAQWLHIKETIPPLNDAPKARRPMTARRRMAGRIALAGAVITGAIMWSGCGGGGGSCSACRQDCINHGIPAPDCNCAGCTSP